MTEECKIIIILLHRPLNQTLPLHEVQSCYLVANKQQFMSIVMSHCHYSFTRGKVTEVHYDLLALERHFLSRFVYGKPLFDLSTACILHQHKHIHNSENFAALRRNVHPQVNFLHKHIIHVYTYAE